MSCPLPPFWNFSENSPVLVGLVYAAAERLKCDRHFRQAPAARTEALLDIQGVFFNWDPPKSSKCQIT